ncbi:unnamed protein product, partial [Rotaria magnacalcarata]
SQIFGVKNIGIFMGIGNESFASQITISTVSSRPLGISIADFNNGRMLDFVIVNYGTHSISVVYGYGSGRYSNPIIYFTGYDSFPVTLAIGDFNKGSYLDIAVELYVASAVPRYTIWKQQ